jgi:hypothetical protein
MRLTVVEDNDSEYRIHVVVYYMSSNALDMLLATREISSRAMKRGWRCCGNYYLIASYMV